MRQAYYIHWKIRGVPFMVSRALQFFFIARVRRRNSVTDVMHREKVKELCRKIAKEQAKLEIQQCYQLANVDNNVPFVQSTPILAMVPMTRIEWVLLSCSG